MKKEEAQKEKALKVSIREGAAAKVAFGLGNGYITPFALALKASTTQIGLLNAFSGFLPQLVQIWSAKLMKTHSRKEIVSKSILWEALLFIPLAITGLLYWQRVIDTSAIYLTIIFYALLSIAGGALYPAWFSWMGDIVPKEKKGKYFSKRNLVIGLVEISSMIAGIFMINWFEEKGLILLGLSIFFIISFLFRGLSYIMIKQQYEPRVKIKEEKGPSFWQFIKKYDNFGKFAIYQGVFYFTLMIASPFFIVYLAKEQGFSAAVYMPIMLSGSAFYLLFLPLVGKFSDKYGNLKLLWLSNLCFAISPVLWLFSASPLYLGIVPQMFIGLANAALTIAYTNFSYDSIIPRHRARYIAYTNLLMGIGTFIGAIAGGLLLDYIPTGAINIFVAVFIFSALLRGAAALYFLPKIKESKRVKGTLHISTSLGDPLKTIYAEVKNINQISQKRYTEGLKIWKGQ